MPEYVVRRIEDFLKEKNIVLKRARILIVGVTYKKDIKDLRKSPSIEMIDILHKRNIKVFYFDPLIPYLKLNHINLKSVELKKEKLKEFDCAVIATDHSNIDYDFLLENSKLIFDTRNKFKGVANDKVIRL
jgi:UDP-N-acetyl-D-glucosamine dehydrogenase